MLPNQADSENQHTGTARSNDFLGAIADAFPPQRWLDYRVVVAVSGGPDSQALVHGLAMLRNRLGNTNSPKLILAHCNYQLRGDESNKDEVLVIRTARQLDAEVFVWKEPISAQPGGIGLEAHLRAIRYGFFARVAKERGSRYLVVGHTQDDHAETVLMRLLRGTSWDGLSGIPAWRRIDEHLTLFRPLIRLSRAAVLEFLDESKIEYRLDSSNQGNAYFRNRIRHDLLPYIEKHFAPEFRTRLLNLAAEATEMQSCLDGLLGEVASAAHLNPPQSMVIDSLALRATPITLIKRLVRKSWSQLGWPLRDMTTRHWTAVAKMIQPATALPADSRHDCLSVGDLSVGDPKRKIAAIKDFVLPGNISVRRNADGAVEFRKN